MVYDNEAINSLEETEMTWVIGTASLFGYGVLFGDTQVTFANSDVRKDILQKVHAIAPGVAIGFAGSVEIGFKLLYSFARIFERSRKNNINHHPCKIAKGWPIVGKKIFDGSEASEKKCGSSLLMVCASPNQNNGDSNFPIIHLIRYKSTNNFEPEFLIPERKPYKTVFPNVYSIGSGSDIKEYEEALSKIFNTDSVWRLSSLGAGLGMAAFEMAISDLIKQDPRFGIGSHIHTMLVTRNINPQMPEWKYFDENGDLVSFNPTVARNYKEFKILANDYGINSVGAIC